MEFDRRREPVYFETYLEAYHPDTGERWGNPPIDITENGCNPLPFWVRVTPIDRDPVIGVDALTGNDIRESDVREVVRDFAAS